MGIALAACAFDLAAAALFAQEDTAIEDIAAGDIAIEESLPIDPITAAEQALPLGGGMESGGAPPPASAASIIRVLLTLAVVAAAIYGIIFLIKRVGRGNAAPDPFLRVLASAPLGVSRRAYVISVGAQAWLVGASESGVSLIGEIGDKEALDAMQLEDSRRSAGDAPAGGGGRPDFKALLQKMGIAPDAGAPSGPESIRRRRERLKGL